VTYTFLCRQDSEFFALLYVALSLQLVVHLVYCGERAARPCRVRLTTDAGSRGIDAVNTSAACSEGKSGRGGRPRAQREALDDAPRSLDPSPPGQHVRRLSHTFLTLARGGRRLGVSCSRADVIGVRPNAEAAFFGGRSYGGSYPVPLRSHQGICELCPIVEVGLRVLVLAPCRGPGFVAFRGSWWHVPRRRTVIGRLVWQRDCGGREEIDLHRIRSGGGGNRRRRRGYRRRRRRLSLFPAPLTAPRRLRRWTVAPTKTATGRPPRCFLHRRRNEDDDGDETDAEWVPTDDSAVEDSSTHRFDAAAGRSCLPGGNPLTQFNGTRK